jgi:hypothetical protein
MSLRLNPIAKEVTYVKLAKEILPSLRMLDDDYVSATTFEYKNTFQ